MSSTNTFGFTKVTITEHDFAKFLRRHKAIDNVQTVGKSNVWIGPDGRTVALCIYDGVGGMVVSYWVRDDIKEGLS